MKHLNKTDLLRYASGILSAELLAEADRHIAHCNACLFKITHALSRKKEACKRAEGMFAGYYSNKLDAPAMDFMRQHLLICNSCIAKYHALAEKKEAAEHELIIKNIYGLTGKEEITKPGVLEIIRKDLNIGLQAGGRSGITVHLQSDKYDVSGVTVSLGKFTNTGFNALLSSVTTTKGTAKLGKTEPQDREKSKYSLHVSGLKKKIK